MCCAAISDQNSSKLIEIAVVFWFIQSMRDIMFRQIIKIKVDLQQRVKKKSSHTNKNSKWNDLDFVSSGTFVKAVIIADSVHTTNTIR